MDTLRSTAEAMQNEAKAHRDHWNPDAALALESYAERLLALLDEAEKTDLVQKWRATIEDARSALTDAPPTVAHDYRIEAERLERCADELATWLAAKGVKK